jgi:hypothetical protein
MKIYSLLVAPILIGCGTDLASEEVANKRSPAAETAAPAPTECDSDHFPMASDTIQDPAGCCQLGNETWHIVPQRAGGIAHREYGPACTYVDGTPGCTRNALCYGPCGGLNLEGPIGASPSFIFKPSDGRAACGWHATLPDGSATYDPEPYTDQEVYPGLVGTCPFTACTPGGTPVVNLDVTAVAAGATGSVKAVPEQLKLAGAGAARWQFADPDVHLVAQPSGRNARAVFSGACAATGKYGAGLSCKLRLGPDKKVTVTYQCAPGLTCL